MKRKAGMSVADFRHYYETVHVPLALSYSKGMQRYLRRYIDPLPNPETGATPEPEFDVVTELWFTNEKVYRATVQFLSTTVMPDAIVTDEKNLFDRAKSQMATVVEYESEL